MNPQISLEDALADVYSREAEPTSHPDEQDLLDYRRGVLATEDAIALADHLVACEECSRFILAAQAFEAPMEKLPAWSTDEVSEDFQRLRRHLEEEESMAPRDATPPDASPVRPKESGKVLELPRKTSWWASPAFGLGLAATLLFIVVGLQMARSRDAVRLAELEAWKAETNRWASSVEVHSVDPWGSVRSANEMTEVRGGDVVLLYMGGDTLGEGAFLEVSTGEDGPMFRVDALKGLEEGVVRLRLPRDGLDPEVYQLALKSKDGALVQTYRFRVGEAGEPRR